MPKIDSRRTLFLGQSEGNRLLSMRSTQIRYSLVPSVWDCCTDIRFENHLSTSNKTNSVLEFAGLVRLVDHLIVFVTARVSPVKCHFEASKPGGMQCEQETRHDQNWSWPGFPVCDHLRSKFVLGFLLHFALGSIHLKKEIKSHIPRWGLDQYHQNFCLHKYGTPEKSKVPLQFEASATRRYNWLLPKDHPVRGHVSLAHCLKA